MVKTNHLQSNLLTDLIVIYGFQFLESLVNILKNFTFIDQLKKINE